MSFLPFILVFIDVLINSFSKDDFKSLKKELFGRYQNNTAMNATEFQVRFSKVEANMKASKTMWNVAMVF